MSDLIYMDNAATTACYEEAKQAMLPFLTEDYANPSSIYKFAAESKKAIQTARRQIAQSIGAKPEEICFTAGGTESDNMAIKVIAWKNQDRGRHIITSKIEHHAVLHACQWLEQQGFEVTYLDVDRFGIVDMEQLVNSIRPDTILISIMSANNEIGTIQPIEQIGRVARSKGVLFHTDAVQAFMHIPINVNRLSVDMMSVSGHKFGGPKGVGFLYIREGTDILPLLHGGAQEFGKRAGTENVPGIVGMGKAVEIAGKTMFERGRKEVRIRDYMIRRISREIKNVRINGDMLRRLPGNMNFCFHGIEGESLLVLLDLDGICASTGSACNAGNGTASHVLLALGVPEELARGSLRLTINDKITRRDADYVVECLKKSIKKLREHQEE